MPAADESQSRSTPRGSGARMRRIRLLQEMHDAGLLVYVELVRSATSYKTATGFRIRVGESERVLYGSDVEAYVDGMLDGLRYAGKLGEDLARTTAEIMGE